MPQTPHNEIMTPESSKRLVDARLGVEFDFLEAEAKGIHPRYARFMNSLRTLGEGGGKRLRPYMAMLSFEAYSGRSGEAILPSAVSLELLHLAMLIHDDIIDRDEVRYGMPNVTGAHMDYYEDSVADSTERRHYADSAAILAGDLLQGHAYYLNEQTEATPVVKQEVRRIVRATSASVIAGELLDTEASFDDTSDIDVATIARHKTASYTFVSPLLVGATFAEAPMADREVLKEIGEEVGIGFQYRDDIIGTYGDPKRTGKSIDSDLREGKRTILTEVFQAEAPQYRQDFFSSVWGNREASPKDITLARQLLRVYAKDAVEGQIRVIANRTKERIDDLVIRDDYKKALRHLVTNSLQRTV